MTVEGTRLWVGMVTRLFKVSPPLDIAPPVETAAVPVVLLVGLCCAVLVFIAIAVVVILLIRKKNKAEKEDVS